MNLSLDRQCFWCGADSVSITRDHIVPRSLGGTLDFFVESCSDCQTTLSKAEHEVARKSVLAVHALTAPIPPRHPTRPTSGHLKPSYVLVPHPLGGYGETLFSAGDKVRALAHLEVKVEDDELQGRIRGASPAEAQKLLDTLRKVLRVEETLSPGELVCELSTNLDIDAEIASDSDFWPRVVLLPGDRLLLRARNPDELVRLMKVLGFIARSPYQIDPSQWIGDHQISGGTLHTIAFRYDPQCVRRVAAKIAYGLFRVLRKRDLRTEEDQTLRAYILGHEDSINEPVSASPDPATSTTSNEPHFVVLSPRHDRSAAFICLYSVYFFRVELGSSAILEEPISALCAIDGSGMRIGTGEETSEFTERVRSKQFSQDWIKEE